MIGHSQTRPGPRSPDVSGPGGTAPAARSRARCGSAGRAARKNRNRHQHDTDQRHDRQNAFHHVTSSSCALNAAGVSRDRLNLQRQAIDADDPHLAPAADRPGHAQALALHSSPSRCTMPSGARARTAHSADPADQRLATDGQRADPVRAGRRRRQPEESSTPTVVARISHGSEAAARLQRRDRIQNGVKSRSEPRAKASRPTMLSA